MPGAPWLLRAEDTSIHHAAVCRRRLPTSGILLTLALASGYTGGDSDDSASGGTGSGSTAGGSHGSGSHVTASSGGSDATVCDAQLQSCAMTCAP